MGAGAAAHLTDQQRTAIELRDVSIALSAGAGCGKTHVLVERYLSHLDVSHEGDGNRSALGGLIAITFTDRAAREMRDRVRRTCRERLTAAASDEDAAVWLRLLRDLESARISTIHAFCATLLRSHAVEASLDPRFEILQPGQSATLFAELLDDELRDQLSVRNEDLIELAVQFGLNPLRGMIQHLLERRQDIDFARWEEMTPESLVSLWQRFERERLLPEARAELLALPAVAEIRKIMRGWTPDHPKIVERFAVLATQLAALEDGEDLLVALDELRGAATVKGISGERHWHSAEVYAQFRDACTDLRNWIDHLRDRSGVGGESAQQGAAAGLALLRVARPIIVAYEKRKRELGVLDFSDLLILARDLLRGPHGKTVLRQLAARLVLLLVDEFQDTDPLQVELVELLCGEQLTAGKLFFVGDAKQSIYRFRGADPRVFRDLRARIPAPGRLPLTRNFRSQPAVLHFVNALFCDRLGPEYEPLEAHRKSLSTETVVEFLWAQLDADEADSFNVEALRRREADFIARRLAGMFAVGEVKVFDKQSRGSRAAGPGDTAILFRALSDVQHYEAALRRYGVPYYLVGGGAFYAQQEVFDLLNLLRVLQYPSDEVSLAGVLRSPFFSLTDESLFWLAQHEGGLAAGLFSARVPRELDEAQRRQVRYAAETLQYFRMRKDRLPISTLIREALARTGYDALLVAEFLGERKLANLRKLIDQARSLDEAGIFTLADFIQELDEFIAREPEEPPAPIEPESSSVVRLMTIHQAKGLEFPVVVVPDLARYGGGRRGPVAFDRELGPLVRVLERSEAGPTGLDLYRLREQSEDAAEEARLFYVATTRAADYLLLAAGLKKLDRPIGPWLELLAERFDLRTGQLQVRLPPGYERPQVLVTCDEPPLPPGVVEYSPHADLEAIAAAVSKRPAASTARTPDFVAAIPVDRAARRVYSFSRLADGLVPADAAIVEPLAVSAAQAETMPDATEQGTLVHAVLAQIDFRRAVDVAAHCRREQQRHFSAESTDPRVAIEMIERFLGSPRATELRAARALHRELEFLLSWPPGAPAADGKMIQGVIDCLYQDGDGHWHVLDYKTNRVTAASVPEAARAYELQMSLYALAAEQALGVRPASLVLHFLQPGVEHVVPWDDSQRARTIEQIDAALQAAGVGA